MCKSPVVSTRLLACTERIHVQVLLELHMTFFLTATFSATDVAVTQSELIVALTLAYPKLSDKAPPHFSL